MASEVRLRAVAEADLPIFFEQQRDPVANRMAAFTAADPADRDVYMARSTRNLGDATNIVRTILADGQVAGSVLSYAESGRREVSYWLGREYWGRGIATRALALYLGELATRPLYARAAADNAASIRVLEKCGFVITGHGRGFANARGAEIDEVFLTLGADASGGAG